MINAETKEFVARRAHWACEYCRSQFAFSPDPFSIEHILPCARGGTSTSDNLAYSCQGCNNHKYIHTEALDTVTGGRVPLFHPRRHVWREHFAWNEDFTLLLGLTPSGRATIDKLCLNRPGVINLREVLADRKTSASRSRTLTRFQPFPSNYGRSFRFGEDGLRCRLSPMLYSRPSPTHTCGPPVVLPRVKR